MDAVLGQQAYKFATIPHACISCACPAALLAAQYASLFLSFHKSVTPFTERRTWYKVSRQPRNSGTGGASIEQTPEGILCRPFVSLGSGSLSTCLSMRVESRVMDASTEFYGRLDCSPQSAILHAAEESTKPAQQTMPPLLLSGNCHSGMSDVSESW